MQSVSGCTVLPDSTVIQSTLLPITDTKVQVGCTLLCCHIGRQKVYGVSSVIGQRFFTSKQFSKKLDLSYKMGLDFFYCFGREKPNLK